jgi:hypothetical protein
VSESLPIDAPDRKRLGCVFALAACVVGVVFASALNWVLIHTRAYCHDVSPAIVVDEYPRGGAYIWGPLFALHVLLYSTLFGITGALVRRRFGKGISLTLVCALAACLLLLALDYSVFNGMAGADPPADYLPGRCPGGHLPWWPTMAGWRRLPTLIRR